MSLQDEMEKIFSQYGIDTRRQPVVAREILALPSGMVAVSACVLINHQYNRHPVNCPNGCHGTGRIERDMSIQEVVNYAKGVSIMHPNIIFNGERVEVKK